MKSSTADEEIPDSTATVIGAMIVAPLMGPIMATAAAVVMGSAERAAQSLALVVAGFAGRRVRWRGREARA